MANNITTVYYVVLLLSLGVLLSREKDESAEYGKRTKQLSYFRGLLQQVENLNIYSLYRIGTVSDALFRTMRYVLHKESRGWGVTTMSAVEESRGWGVTTMSAVEESRGWGVTTMSAVEESRGWGVTTMSAVEESRGWGVTTMSAVEESRPGDVSVIIDWVGPQGSSVCRTVSRLLSAVRVHDGIVRPQLSHLESSVKCPTYPRSISSCTPCAVKTVSLEEIVLAYHDYSYLINQTVRGCSVSAAASIPYLLLNSLLGTHCRSWMTVIHEKMSFSMFKIHQRTKCIFATVRIVNIIKLYRNISQAVVLLFRESCSQSLSTKVATTILSSFFLPHDNSPTSNLSTCLPHDNSPTSNLSTCLPHDNSLTSNLSTCLPHDNSPTSNLSTCLPHDNSPTSNLSTSLPHDNSPTSNLSTCLPHDNSPTSNLLTCLPHDNSPTSNLSTCLPHDNSPTSNLSTCLPHDNSPTSNLSTCLPHDNSPTSNLSTCLPHDNSPTSNLSTCLPHDNSPTSNLSTCLPHDNSLTSNLSTCLPHDNSPTSNLSTCLPHDNSPTSNLSTCLPHDNSPTSNLSTCLPHDNSPTSNLSTCLPHDNSPTSNLSTCLPHDNSLTSNLPTCLPHDNSPTSNLSTCLPHDNSPTSNLSTCLPHDNSPTSNLSTCLPLLLCGATPCCLKHNHSTSHVNTARTCKFVSFAQKLSLSQFSRQRYMNAINILYFLVTIVYVQKYLCKKGIKNQHTKLKEKRMTFGNDRFFSGSVKDSYSSKQSPSWHRTSMAYNIIHHQWRHSLQCIGNINPNTSAHLKRRKSHNCLSSTSTLCSDCKNLVVFHQERRTKRHSCDNSEDCNTPVVSLEAQAPLWSQPVLHLYPVTRFLPDPTRNPSLDLAHVGYRLATLSALSASVPVSRIRLADAGFYTRGVNSDEVTCYSCHARHSGWTTGDNPLEVHRRLSPNCAHVLLLQQRDEEMSAAPTAVPSAGSVEAAARPASCGRSGNDGADGVGRQNHASGSSASLSANGCFEDGENAGISATAESSGRAGSSIDPTAIATSRTSSSSQSASAAPNSTSVGTHNVPAETGRIPGTRSLPAEDRRPPGTQSLPAEDRGPSGTQRLPAEDRRPSGTQSLPAEDRRPPGTSFPQSSSPSSVTTSTVQQNGSSVNPTPGDAPQGSSGAANQSLFPRARLDLGGAVYPMYQSMASRRATFSNVRWDETQAPPLMVIVLSGMFYAGYRDCVRCFYCGVGLKQWVVSDDVWAEHVRWRPECQYLRSVRGDGFISNTQRRLAIAVNSSPAPTSTTTTASATAPTATATAVTTPAAIAPAATAPAATAPTATATAATAPAATAPAAAAPAATPLSQGNASISQTTSATSSSVTTAAVAAVPESSGPGSSNSSSNGSNSSNNDGQRSSENTSSGGASISVGAEDEQQRVARLRAENQTLAQRLRCKVCHQAPIETILLPCAHLVVCERCAGTVTSCPLCGQAVRATARVHMA